MKIWKINNSTRRFLGSTYMYSTHRSIFTPTQCRFKLRGSRILIYRYIHIAIWELWHEYFKSDLLRDLIMYFCYGFEFITSLRFLNIWKCICLWTLQVRTLVLFISKYNYMIYFKQRFYRFKYKRRRIKINS